MTYFVRWTRSALNDLARVWLNADSATRRAITAATDQIDSNLSREPENAGESRAGNRRVVFVPPLVVVFSVDTKQHRVRVLHVWQFGQATG